MEDILKLINFRNKDRLLALVKREEKPVFYSDIESELGFSIDYVSHLLRDLKTTGLVKVKSTILRGRSRKIVELTDFGKAITEEITRQWLNPREIRWLKLLREDESVFNEVLSDSSTLVKEFVESSSEDISQAISESLMGHIGDKILIKAITGDIIAGLSNYVEASVQS